MSATSSWLEWTSNVTGLLGSISVAIQILVTNKLMHDAHVLEQPSPLPSTSFDNLKRKAAAGLRRWAEFHPLLATSTRIGVLLLVGSYILAMAKTSADP